MTPGLLPSLGVLVWAGLCSADQRAVASRQLHQPIVAAVGAGWILGQPERALLVGLWMQMVWPVPMPVGGSLLPDTGAAAVAAAVIAIAVPGGAGLLAAILVGLLAARLTVPWERSLRTANGKREERTLAAANAGLTRAIVGGVAGPFLRGVVIAGVALAAARLAGGRVALPSLAGGHGALTRSLIGGAGVLGVAALLARVPKETGPRWLLWTGSGLLVGAVGRFLLGAAR